MINFWFPFITKICIYCFTFDWAYWQTIKPFLFWQCLLHRPGFQHLIAAALAAVVVFLCCSIYYLSGWHCCPNPNSAPAAAVVFLCCSIYYLSGWHCCPNPNSAPAAAVVFLCCSIYYLSGWHRCPNPNSNNKILEKRSTKQNSSLALYLKSVSCGNWYPNPLHCRQAY